jgi:hypothetical protein
MNEFGFGAFVMFCGALAFMLMFSFAPRSYFEYEAIENNAAYYACDDKSGDCVFTWGAK